MSLTRTILQEYREDKRTYDEICTEAKQLLFSESALTPKTLDYLNCLIEVVDLIEKGMTDEYVGQVGEAQ